LNETNIEFFCANGQHLLPVSAKKFYEILFIGVRNVHYCPFHDPFRNSQEKVGVILLQNSAKVDAKLLQNLAKVGVILLQNFNIFAVNL